MTWHPDIPEEYRNQIVTGDARELAKRIPDNSVDLVLTDPPYFRVKSEAWDRQWKNDDAFLAWIESIVVICARIIKPNGSLLMFASPRLVNEIETLTKKHMQVLNNMRWIKKEGHHKRSDKEALRSFLSPWEAIIFAEQYIDEYGDAEKALHKEVFAPIGRYLQTERERAGVSRNDVEVALGFVSKRDPSRGTALCYRWEEGSSLPTEKDYYRMRDYLNSFGTNEYLRKDYEELRKDYEELRKDYEELRRPFSGEIISTDILNYPIVHSSPSRHPCEKPVSLLADLIKTTTKDSALVLDLFSGSGSTGEAAIATGRKFIGFEKSAEYIERANRRVKNAKNLWRPQPEQKELGI